MAQINEIPRDSNPFPRTGVSRDANGVPRYDNLPATLLDMLAEQVDRRPDSEAVTELGGERLTYRQLWDRASRVAGGLRAGGLKPGGRVAVRYPAGVNWVLALWGTIMAGGVAVPVNTRSAQPEVEFLLGDAGAQVDLAPNVALPDGRPYATERLATADTAAIFYTSGTSGRPKGVPTTHEAFLTSTENTLRCHEQVKHLGEVVRTLITVPLSHMTAFNSQLLITIGVGGTSVIMPALDIDLLIATLQAERISLMVTVPALYSLMLRHKDFAATDVSGVHWVGYGGAPIAPSLVRTLQDTFPQAKLFNGYGMTETASVITMLPYTDAVEHADSVGYAVPSVDLYVVPIGDDPNVGELVVRGANVTAGYWNRPEANDATIVHGRLHTGDVVRVDDAGRLHIIDRLKDIINRGGENVSSVEVEAALLSAPHVADACVLAVPDDIMGEKVGAVLFGGEDEIDVAAVLDHCSSQLADFKVPQYVTVVTEALPRNAAGKLLKSKLQEQVQWGRPVR